MLPGARQCLSPRCGSQLLGLALIGPTFRRPALTAPLLLRANQLQKRSGCRRITEALPRCHRGASPAQAVQERARSPAAGLAVQALEATRLEEGALPTGGSPAATDRSLSRDGSSTVPDPP